MRLTTLETPQQLDALFDESRSRPVWILKHSTACGVSAAALEEVRSFAAGYPDDARFVVLVVQQARTLSNELARRAGVPHRSPQLLLLRDGEVAWQASHWAIDHDELRRAAERAGAGPREHRAS